jgi:hypothetical protein
MKSLAQNRFMRWADAHPAEAKRENGITPKVTGEFIAATHGHSLACLPQHVEHRAEGGRVATYPRPFKW